MSSASEKAADRMHADLDAMFNSARMHAGLSPTPEGFEAWQAVYQHIAKARAAIVLCMNERDRKIAQG